MFDALTVEDITTITTCYPSPGIKSNPIALGTRLFIYFFNYVQYYDGTMGLHYKI